MITLKETRGDMVKVKSSVNRRVWGMMLNEILKKMFNCSRTFHVVGIQDMFASFPFGMDTMTCLVFIPLLYRRVPDCVEGGDVPSPRGQVMKHLDRSRQSCCPAFLASPVAFIT